MNPVVPDKIAIAPVRQTAAAPCINCGHPARQNYCESCGQRTSITRISWKGLLQELSAKWLGFDNQFCRTLWHLSIKPGVLIKSYLAGNRVTYLGPLSYYIVVTALVFLGLALLGISVEEFMQSTSSSLVDTEVSQGRALAFQQEVLHVMSSALRFMIILFVPFFAWVAQRMYRKSGLNFLEFCVLLIYSSAHLFWLTLLQALLYGFTGQTFSTASIIISLLYYGFFYQDVLEKNKSVRGFIKGMFTYVLGFMLLVTAMMLVIIPVVIIRIKLNG